MKLTVDRVRSGEALHSVLVDRCDPEEHRTARVRIVVKVARGRYLIRNERSGIKTCVSVFTQILRYIECQRFS